MTDHNTGGRDIWLSWLKSGRDAANDELRSQSLAYLRTVYERLIMRAEIQPGEAILEVGAGKGMLGLMGLAEAGPEGSLILSDISAEVIRNLEGQPAAEVRNRVRLVTTPAEQLAGIDDESVDVVLVRSVLIYTTVRAAAIRAIARKLRPGGRLCIYEPLWRFFDPETVPGEYFGRELRGFDQEIAALYNAGGQRIGSLLDHALTAEELIEETEAAGLSTIAARIEANSEPFDPGDDIAVHRALHGRPNPHAATTSELASAVLPPGSGRTVPPGLGAGRTRWPRKVAAGSGLPDCTPTSVMGRVLPRETGQPAAVRLCPVSDRRLPGQGPLCATIGHLGDS